MVIIKDDLTFLQSLRNCNVFLCFLNPSLLNIRRWSVLRSKPNFSFKENSTLKCLPLASDMHKQLNVNTFDGKQKIIPLTVFFQIFLLEKISTMFMFFIEFVRGMAAGIAVIETVQKPT